MKDLFVPYELAIKFRANGFKFDNDHYWVFGKYVENYPEEGVQVNAPYIEDQTNETGYIFAPTYQQAIDWFETKGIYITAVFPEDKKEKGVYNYINMPYFDIEIKRRTALHGGAIQNDYKFVQYSANKYRCYDKAFEEVFTSLSK